MCVPAAELERLFQRTRIGGWDDPLRQRLMKLGIMRYTAMTGLVLGALIVPRLLS